MLNVGILDVVHDHIHLTNRPYRCSIVLPEQSQLTSIAALLLNILLAVNKHTAAADRGIVYFHVFLRLNDSHHQLNDS